MEALAYAVWWCCQWVLEFVIPLASIWPVSLLCAGVKRLLGAGSPSTPAYAIPSMKMNPYDAGLF